MKTQTLSVVPGTLSAALLAATGIMAATDVVASSHREAPLITEMPKVDATDFYMFRSYEPGREDFVTLIANYVPMQLPGGGPNYFAMDPGAVYEIHIDNNGDAIEDLSFRFRFVNMPGASGNGITLDIGGIDVAVPLLNIGPLGTGDNSAVENFTQHYIVKVTEGDRRTGNRTHIGTFRKPMDNIGAKSIPDYDAYAASLTNTGAAWNEANLPICDGDTSEIRIFAGQRRESFAVNLGEVFDLVNTNPLGAPDGETSDLENLNITTLALEVPIDCLTGDGDSTVIAGWTTASMRKIQVLEDNPGFDVPTTGFGRLAQVSRLGMPLVNEVVIGLPDKDRFNASEPVDDEQFADYVTNPTLPTLLQVLFGVDAPTNYPRLDLVGAFLTGITGLNDNGSVAEMQRLNVAVSPTPAHLQHNLGVLGGDSSGFPNGRRPGDDVVDIELRVAMGVLCHALPGLYCDPSDALAGDLPYTDGALQDASQFDTTFPYLRSPLAGSPN